jgi:hypothetical protein
MISHPLASDVRIPRQLAPTVGPFAASAGDTFWAGTAFLSDEHVAASLISQPNAFACACSGASFDAGAVCPTSCLADLFGKLSLSDADATDGFPSDVVVINDQLPPVSSVASAGALDAGVFVEVMVTGNSQASGGAVQDPLQAAMQDLAAPVGANADAAALE